MHARPNASGEPNPCMTTHAAHLARVVVKSPAALVQKQSSAQRAPMLQGNVSHTVGHTSTSPPRGRDAAQPALPRRHPTGASMLQAAVNHLTSATVFAGQAGPERSQAHSPAMGVRRVHHVGERVAQGGQPAVRGPARQGHAQHGAQRGQVHQPWPGSPAPRSSTRAHRQARRRAWSTSDTRRMIARRVHLCTAGPPTLSPGTYPCSPPPWPPPSGCWDHSLGRTSPGGVSIIMD